MELSAKWIQGPLFKKQDKPLKILRYKTFFFFFFCSLSLDLSWQYFCMFFIFCFALSSHAPLGMEVHRLSHMAWGPTLWGQVAVGPDHGNIPQSNTCPGPAFLALGQWWPPKVFILCQDVLGAWSGGDEGLVSHPWRTPWCCQPWTVGRDGPLCPGSVLYSCRGEVPAGGKNDGESRPFQVNMTRPWQWSWGRDGKREAWWNQGARELWEDSWEPISERQRGQRRQDCVWAEALSSRHVPLSHPYIQSHRDQIIRDFKTDATEP